MSTGSNIQDSILKAIDTMAQRRIDQLQLDKTITAIINTNVGVTPDKRKIYKVEYEGGYFNATAQNQDDMYLPRMAVYVQVPQGDFSKEKFILGRASKLATDEQVSVVSATNNSFSIIGKNVINNKVEKMGVYSYHSPTEEKNSNTLNHRFNFLYKSDYDQEDNQIIPDENLDLYKKDATAIMVRAEFMTKLTNEQKKKATGEYGLVFDLVFNNLAAGLGETQYDVFKHFREKVKANRIVDGETEEFSLDTIDTKLVEALKEKTHTELTETDGYLDEILSDIQELDRVYKNNNQTEYTFAVQDLISKYTILVQDIKRVEDEEKFRQNMQKLYQDWMDEIIGQPAEKHVSYYLSSNDMIGNPFSFSSWISQYNIFEIDLENFKRIDSILLYKQGFIEDAVKEAKWLDHEPDILVRDIQVYAMRSLSDNNSGYQLKVEGKDTGFVFEGKESDVNIIANATLLREYFEDLTRNSDTTFYWFKQSENIVSPMQSEYSIYGGIGWSEIDNQNSTKLEITKEDAPAYENHFRCAAVYMGEEVPIVLRYDFIIYNYLGQRFTLQSDLGTDFTFDAGIPTITVYSVITEEKDGKEVERLEELHNNNQYKFKWAIIDGNNQKVFLDTKPELDLTDMTVSNFNNYSNTSKLLKDIKWYRGDTEVTTETDKAYATKIKYPMSNIASSANITFECYISYRKEDEEDFYPLGKTELTLNNFKILNANSYRIWIENGDQVFQYDEYGNAPNVDKYKDPIEVLPLKIHLFAPSNIEVQDSSFRTKWYFPTEESLIVYNSDEAEIDPETNNKNMFRGSEIGFDIEKMYNYNFTNNQIRCQIDFNNQTLYADTSFVFTKVGNNGTNGTDMVAKIVPREWRNILSIQPFTLYIDKKNNKVFSNLNVPADGSYLDILSNTLNLTGEDNFLISKLYQKSQEVDVQRIRWNIAGNTSTATNKKGKYIKIENDELIWDNDINNSYNQYILKVELNYRNPNKNNDKTKTYYAFYSLPIIIYEDKPPFRESARIAIKDSSYIKEVVYNADGRNPLYNHNQGLELINVPDDCLITWEACGGYNENENLSDFSLLLEKDSRESVKKIEDIGQKRIYILPNDDFDGATTNNYIKAIVKKNNIEIATIIAPVNMSLNTFGLASLNAWDGNSVTIDEDEGYIMAPQIGAGYKDEETNLFTGAVMGQADDYSSGEEHLYTGLLGYKNGMRSFFLDAENGNAIFGYPTLNGTTDKVKKYENGQWKEIDNYNEGEIQLIPGDISKIGGWRLGRKSLYYTAKKIKNNEEYEYSGKIGKKYDDPYAKHHIKDIDVDDQGILLSAIPPYISIKGREITEEQSDENSQIKKGDSVEIQLDPENIASLAIFRHYMDGDKEKREQLSGLNNKGQLVANQMIQIPAKDEEEEQSTKTSLGIENFTVFNTPHTGLSLGLKKVNNFDENTNPFFRVSLSSDQIETDDQIYITAGRTNDNDYVRPISVHGKSISLYAIDKTKTTESFTTSYIKISQTNLSGKINDTVGFDFNDGRNNLINVRDPLTIKTNNKAFILNTGDQAINSASIEIINTGKYTLTNTGVIDINTNSNADIKLIRNSGSNINIGAQNINIKINDNNDIKLDSSSNGGSYFKTNSPLLEIINNNGRLYNLGKSGVTGRTDLGDSASQIVIKAQDNSSNNYSVIRLGANVNNYVGITQNGSYVAGYPFTMLFGADSSGSPHCGSIYVRTSNTGRNSGNLNSNRVELNALGLQVAQGIEINGNLLNDAHESRGYGLRLNNNLTISTSGGANRYTFANTSITNGYTADGTNLQDLIWDCLGAAQAAKNAADAAQNAANAAQNAADNAQDTADTARREAANADAHAGRAETAANNAQNSANNKVDKGIYNISTDKLLIDEVNSDVGDDGKVTNVRANAWNIIQAQIDLR